MMCGAADEGSAALFVCGEPDPGVGGREWVWICLEGRSA